MINDDLESLAARAQHSPRGAPRRLGRCLLAAALTALAGCNTILAVHEQQALAAEFATLSGTITGPEGLDCGLVVGLLTRGEDGSIALVDHFYAERAGPWVFGVVPGTYWVAAFADVDRDGHYDQEPGLPLDESKAIVLAAGQLLGDLDLQIESEGRLPLDSFKLEDILLRTGEEQEVHSEMRLSTAGVVTTLDDPRFAREAASSGMWRFYEFLQQRRSGVYFLQEYDPDKIPVLFVHGLSGTPLDFRALIESLDHERFQPWVYYYPSGGELDGIAIVLGQLLTRLRVQYGFERAAVVAYSMGGLVSRRCLLQDFEANGTEVVQTLVTICSPLGGMASAGKAVENSPVVVHSWRDMAPDGPFLEALYYADPGTHATRRRLPAHIRYHLLFGYKGESGDGVVSIASQLQAESQEEAASMRGFDETHIGILESKAAARRLNEILAAMR